MRGHATTSRLHRMRRWWWATPLHVRLVPAVGVVALAVGGAVSALPGGEPTVHAEPPAAPAMPTTTTQAQPPPPPPPPPPRSQPPAPEPEPEPPAPVTTTTSPPPETTTVAPPPPPPPTDEVVFWGQRCATQGETAEHVDGTPMVCDYLFGSLRFRPA